MQRPARLRATPCFTYNGVILTKHNLGWQVSCRQRPTGARYARFHLALAAVSAYVLPPVLIFGPFDPSGAVSLPADAITCAALQCHGLGVLTANTVQDSARQEDLAAISHEFIDEQARCLLEDMAIRAIKVGGLHTPEAVSVIAQIAADYNDLPLVLHLEAPGDAGDLDAQDLAEDVLAATIELLLPQADIVIAEHLRVAQWLADGLLDEPSEAGDALREGGAEWSLLLGSPLRGETRCALLGGPDGLTRQWKWQPAQERLADGADLVATAIAALLARGLAPDEAVAQAVEYAQACLQHSFRPGMGRRVAWRLQGDPQS